MANEIEFKVEITKKEYEDFKKNNKKMIKEFVSKSDEFYHKNDKGTVIRIRKSNDDYYLCYKEKTITSSKTEVTKEFETKIDDPDVFRHIMGALGESIFFKKTKDALEVVFDRDPLKDKYNIEFVIVNDKFYYIEIEWIADFTSKIKNSDDVIEFLEQKVRDLGFDPSNKDIRPWMQIIKDDAPMKTRDPIDEAFRMSK